MVRYRFSFILSPVSIQFSQNHLLKVLFFPYYMVWISFVRKELTVYICFISVLSYFISVTLFHLYIYIIGILICISFDGNEITHISCFLTICFYFAMNCLSIAFLVSFRDFFLILCTLWIVEISLLSVIYDEDIFLAYAFLFLIFYDIFNAELKFSSYCDCCPFHL